MSQAEEQLTPEEKYIEKEIDWTDEGGELANKVVLKKHELVALLVGWQDKSGNLLMRVLVDGGIVLKDAPPTFSELLATVAQLANSQEVCPKCEGRGWFNKYTEGFSYSGRYDYPRPYPSSTVNRIGCPACQGTGKAEKHSPDRETIAKMICFWHIGDSNMWDKGEGIGWQGPPKTDYYEIADQLIALFPAEEEIRKQERERVIDIMNAISAWTLETRQYRDMIIEEIIKKRNEERSHD